MPSVEFSKGRFRNVSVAFLFFWLRVNKACGIVRSSVAHTSPWIRIVGKHDWGTLSYAQPVQG